MKTALLTKTLKAGLAVSLLVHVAAAVSVKCFWSDLAHKPVNEERAVTLTFIDGVEETVEPTAATAEPAIAALPAPPSIPEPPPQLPSQPPAPAPEPVIPSPTPLPVVAPAPVRDSTPTAAPPAHTDPPKQPALAVPPAASVRPDGDGSARNAGPDTATRLAPPGLRATPLYRKNPEPPYPPAARRRRQEGLVLLTVAVNAQGRATRVELKQSSGFPLLDDAATRAVLEWGFEPARLGTVALASEIEVPVRFQLSR